MSDLLPDDLPDHVRVTSVGEVMLDMASGPVLTVCFDLDGCLVDSREAIGHSLNVAFEEHGLPMLPPAELAPLIGPPLRESLVRIVDELLGDPDDVDALLATFRRHYTHDSLRLTTRVPGIREALNALDPWARVGVVTSKPLSFAVPIVDVVGLRRFVSFVEGPALEATDEPKARTLARTLDRWGSGDGVVMIGDRSHDVLAGQRNGAVTVGVTWGIGSRVELEAAGADHVIDAPAELPDLLRRIRADVAAAGYGPDPAQR